ncbi:MAG: ABC transporter ATP-binding protein [Paludibacteraceae bacterium]|nr:ABC transporter ATP-binding protein [Paludibacteraceae bacterium]
MAIGYGQRVVQDNLELHVYSGELVCMLGMNGCGKTTLLRTLSGLQNALSGHVRIHGACVQQQADMPQQQSADLSQLDLQVRAQQIAVVLTDRVDTQNLSVFDVVATGRYPYATWLGKLTNADRDAIQNAIAAVGLQPLTHRYLSDLSDGERQRVMIAKALAQDTPIILLDEPTAHLDLPNRMSMMLLLRQLAHEQNKAVLMSTHELELALQAADKLWLLQQQKPVVCGIPEDLVLNESLQQVFQSDSYIFDLSDGSFEMKHRTDKSIGLDGEPVRCYWTRRALARLGYRADKNASPSINVTAEAWVYNNQTYKTLGDLLANLNR